MFDFLKIKNLSIFFSLVFSLIFVFISKDALASTIYFEKTNKQVSVSQVFRVDLLLNTDNKSINAFESSIFFDKDMLDIKGIYDGGSIVSYWIKKPKAQGDQIFFSGMTPGGVVSDNGRILSIIFIAKKDGLAKIELKDPKFLLNDGDATEDFLNINNLYISIDKLNLIGQPTDIDNTNNSSDGTVIKTPDGGLIDLIEEDSSRPENFMVKVIKDKNINNGAFSLIFYAQDKSSGIDHYEIKEGDDIFREVTSPYLLKSQDLTKSIEVKAIDKSGNYRIEKIGPLVVKENKMQINYNFVIYSLLFSIFVLILTKLYLDKRHKKMLNVEKNGKIE